MTLKTIRWLLVTLPMPLNEPRCTTSQRSANGVLDSAGVDGISLNPHESKHTDQYGNGSVSPPKSSMLLGMVTTAVTMCG